MTAMQRGGGDPAPRFPHPPGGHPDRGKRGLSSKLRIGACIEDKAIGRMLLR
jgi:hypothetical protein